MPRARFIPSRHTLLLAVLMAAMIGGALWWVKPPPEPVYKGWPLSRWLVDEPDGAHPIGVRYDFLRSKDPAVVKWLAYKVEYGRHEEYRPHLRPSGGCSKDFSTNIHMPARR